MINTSDHIVSASLRIFVDSTSDTRSLSVDKYSQVVQWDEGIATFHSFGAPSLEQAGPVFQVTSSNAGKWLDIDVSDLVRSSNSAKLDLVINDTSDINVSGGKCAFASRETCRSPKLVLLTEVL